MTIYILVLLAYVQGALHHDAIRVESEESCMGLAELARRQMPGIVAGCVQMRVEAT